MIKKLLPIALPIAFFALVNIASANLTQLELQPQSSFTCNATGTIFYSSSNNQLMLCTSGTGSSPVLTSGGSGGTSASFSSLTVSGLSSLSNTNGTESIDTAGIRGANNGVQQLNVYDRVSIGYPSGWNAFPTAPPEGIYTYGSAVFAGNSGIVDIGSANNNPSTLNNILDMGASSTYRWIQSYGSKPLALNPVGNNVGINTASPGTALDVAGNMQSSIYYDRDNTNYYMDLAANTMPYSINAAGSGVFGGSIVAGRGDTFMSYLGLDRDYNSNNVGLYWNAKWNGDNPSTYNYINTGAWGGTASRLVASGNSLAYDQASGGTNPLTWTNRLTINSSGNVGIGTTNPYSSLEVLSGSNTQGLSFFTSSYDSSRQYGTRIYTHDDSGGIPLYFDWQSGSTWNTLFRIGSNSADSNKVETFGQTALASTGGNVGIGTITPTTAGLVVATNVSGAAVDVQNNRIINVGTPVNAADAATKNYVDSAVATGVSGGVTGTSGYIAKFTGTNTVGNSEIYDTGSAVGIGTTGPGQKLTVNGDTYINNQLEVGGIVPSVSSQGRIAATGNTAEVTWLDRNASSWNDSQRYLWYAANGWSYFWNGGNTIIGIQQGAPSNVLTINSSGQVGIGASPATTLDVNGNINVGSTLYDRANTNYYVNPSGNIMPYAANLNGDIYTTATHQIYSSYDGNLIARAAAFQLDPGTTFGSLTGWSVSCSTGNNEIVSVAGPYGGQVKAWDVFNTGSSNVCGGTSEWVPADPRATYRFSIWIMEDTTNPTVYLGVHTQQSGDTLQMSSGSSNTNPYFWYGDLPSMNTWYLIEGYVYPYGVSNTSAIAGGIYDTSGRRVANIQAEFRFPANTATGMQIRFWNAYGTGTNNAWFFDPKIEEVNDFQNPQIYNNLGVPGMLTVGGSMYSIEHDYGTVTGAMTIDWSQSNTQTLVLGASPIALTFSNGQPGAHYTLALKQDATGSRLVTWPGNVRWSSGVAPTLTTTANKTDYVEFVYDGLSSTFDGVGFNANF